MFDVSGLDVLWCGNCNGNELYSLKQSKNNDINCSSSKYEYLDKSNVWSQENGNCDYDFILCGYDVLKKYTYVTVVNRDDENSGSGVYRINSSLSNKYGLIFNFKFNDKNGSDSTNDYKYNDKLMYEYNGTNMNAAISIGLYSNSYQNGSSIITILKGNNGEQDSFYVDNLQLLQ